MLKMYLYWKNNLITIVKPKSTNFVWPIGVKATFKYYLNYYPELPWGVDHESYRDQYIVKCWTSHPEIYQYHHNKIAEFKTDFINNVLRHDYPSGYILKYYQPAVLMRTLIQYSVFTPVSSSSTAHRVTGTTLPLLADVSHESLVSGSGEEPIEEDDHCGCLPTCILS